MSRTSHSQFEIAAIGYAEQGWPVAPWSPNKHPLTPNGFKDATRDFQQIERSWKKWPNAMIVTPTGEMSGLLVVDLEHESKGHGDGLAAWEELIAEHGPVSTRTARTPGGGRHLFFKHVPGVRNVGIGKIAPGVEVKGDGGNITLAPSRRHDGAYEWIDASVEIADAPQWLIERIGATGRRKPKPSPSKAPSHQNGSAHPSFIADEDAGKGLSDDPADSFQPPSIEKIKAALAVIDPDCDRHVWIANGCGLYKELGDEVGFTVWDEWSSEGRKYDAASMRGQWDSIVVGGGYGYKIATVFHHADAADLKWRREFAAAAETVDVDPEIEMADAAEPEQSAKPEQAEKPEQSSAKAEKKTGSRPLIQSAADFVAGFVPPDYLIEGVLQRSYLYSMTGQTGSGKTAVALRLAAHVALGQPLNGLEIDRGKVLFLAGENPDDVRSRWIMLCEECVKEFDKELLKDPSENVCFVDTRPLLSSLDTKKAIRAETASHGPFALAIIDTSAAFFEGKDENDNVDAGAHARMLRSYIGRVSGGPTIIVTTHPTKNPDINNLLPRGGGAFLAEVDGNLVCLFNKANMTVEVTTHGKFRGPDFAPISFELRSGTNERLRNSRGRPIYTITARPISDAQKADLDDQSEDKLDHLLIFMKEKPGLSIREMATQLGWFFKSGEPNRSLVARSLARLKAGKLVEKEGRTWMLTANGKKAATRAAERADTL